MSLQTFLGRSSEIALVDFLAENNDFAYTISEISEFTGLSRPTVHSKLPMLIYNRLVEIDSQAGHVKTYRLARNEFVGTLITAVYQHSFLMAEAEDDNEALEKIGAEIDQKPEYSENRYYNPARTVTGLERSGGLGTKKHLVKRGKLPSRPSTRVK